MIMADPTKSQVNPETILNPPVPKDPYEKKYFALLARCDQIKQSNEKLVNRIFYVKKVLQKMRKERRFLMDRLDFYGDDYRNIPFTLFSEESTPPSAPPETKLDMNGFAGQFSIPASSASNVVHHPGASSSPATQPSGLKNTPSLSHASGPPRKKARQDKDRDPNAPKRPANPFFLYCQDQRISVMERHHQDHKDEINHQELTKDLAKSWNNLSSEDKKVYYDLYEREKERYEQEMKLYTGKDGNTSADKT